MRSFFLTICSFALFFSQPAFAQTVTFDGQDYKLAYVAANTNSVLNEYVPSGYTVDNYEKMMAAGIYRAQSVTPSQFAEAMGKKLKSDNPKAGFQVIANEKTGEAIIDFLIWQPGSKAPAEFNIFKFKQDTASGDITYVHYVFRDMNTNFGDTFKSNRTKWIEALSKQPYPALTTQKP